MLHPSTVLSSTSAILFLLSLSVSGASAQEIRWTHSPQAAVDLAHQSDRMILVSVGAEWCHYCKKMEKEVWKEHSIVRLVQNHYVPLKLSDERHQELVQTLQVQAYPTTLVFMSDRRLIARLEGFVGAEKMRDALNQIHIAVREGKFATR